MINRDMRSYNYFSFGATNEYGEPKLSSDIKGSIKMTINILNQSTQDNILYRDASYIALTFGNIDDSCVIQYGDKKLKVLYVNPKGRYKQVFLKEM